MLDRFVADAQQGSSPTLDSVLADWSATPGQQPLLLTGTTGTGRASALCRFAARKTAAGEGVVLHHATLAASGAEPPRLLWHLLVQLRRIAGIPEWPPPLEVDMREALPNWLARAAARGPSWLIVVDIDATADAAGHIAWLPEYWPPNLRVAASSSEGACTQHLTAAGWRPHHATAETHARAHAEAAARQALLERPTPRADPVSDAAELRRAGRRDGALDALVREEALLATETPEGRMQWLAEWQALHPGSLRDVLVPMLLVAKPRHWLAAAELVDAVGEDVPADWLEATAVGTNPDLCAHARLWQARLAARAGNWVIATQRAEAALMLAANEEIRIRARHELARAAEGAGDLHRAIHLYEQALQRQQAVRGEHSVALLPALANLVGVLRAAHQLNRAGQFARRAMHLARAGCGPAHPATAAACDQLAAVAYAQADYAEAEAAYREALQIVEAAFGPRHSATAAALHNLGTVLDARRAFVDAEACYRRALAIREKARGREHEDTAATLHNLAATLETVGRADEAERIYRETTDIWEKLHGAEHPATLSSLTNLAGVLGARGAWADAEVCYRAAAAGWQRLLGAEHTNTLATLAELGRLYAAGGKPGLAGPLLEHVVETTGRVLGDTDRNHVNAVCSLAAFWLDQGRGDDARNLLDQALANAVHELGLLAPSVQQLRHQLDTLDARVPD